MKRMQACAIVLWVSAVAALAQTGRKSEIDPAAWVPADAVVYFGITDTDRLWSDFKKTTDYAMLNDKDLAGGKGELGPAAMITKVKERLAKLLEVAPDELKSPLAGPLALYLTAPRGAKGKDLEPGFVAGVGDAETMQKYFATATKRLKESATNYETVEAGGETIHVFTKEKADKKSKTDAEEDEEPGKLGPGMMTQEFEKALDEMFSPEQMPEKLAACLTKDRLIVAASAEQVRQILSRKDTSDTLAGTEDHKALLQNLKPTGEVRMLVNLPRVFELVKADAGKDDDVARWMGTLGAGSLRSVVGHMRFGAKSYDARFELLFLMSGERTGLARLLSMENRAVAPPASVPASASIFVSLNVNPPALLGEILRMVRQSDPAEAQSMEQALEAVPLNPQAEPLNLRKDFIDHMTGPLTATVAIARPFGPGAAKLLLSLGHRNRDAITRVISQLPGTKPREFHGVQIFEAPMGPGALAVTGDRILAGNVPALEAALTGDPTETLADDPGFRRALRLVPKEAWCTFYLDTHKLLEALTEMSKKPGDVAADPMLAGIIMGLQMTGTDLSDSAKSRKMLSYSQPLIVTVATTTEGVQFTAVKLKPTE